jgi:DNA-nicking Smr family endonuclease
MRADIRAARSHDPSIVTEPNGKDKGRADTSRSEREALREAFAGVEPLRAKSARRVRKPVEPAARPVSRPPGSERDPLLVERESNGIVIGKRPGLHRSILEALEDPKLEVEAEWDLHGRTAKEAERDVQAFLRHCQQAGKHWVLIIVGKGLHSRGGKGTLQQEVIEALSRGAPSRFVMAFQTAPRRLGGTGAIVVRLR